jgi:hypothetical protein
VREPRRRQPPLIGLEQALRDTLHARYRQEVRAIHEPSLASEIRPDFLGRLADGSLLVVEAVNRIATPTDVVRLVGTAQVVEAHARTRPRRAGSASHPTEMLLLAPSFSTEARRTAALARVTLQVLPSLAIRLPEMQGRLPQTRVPLTSDPSWNVVSQLISRGRFPTVRALATASKSSYAWTHTVVAYLASLSLVRRTGNAVEISEMQRLLDYVGMERPMLGLRSLELPVAEGIPAPELIRLVRELFPSVGSMSVCGLSAASAHGSALEFPQVLQVYAEVPHDVRNALAHKTTLHPGGVLTTHARRPGDVPAADVGGSARLEFYRPDRDVASAASALSGAPVVSLRQTLLDCAGLGSAGHRAIVQLVNARADAA